MLALVHVLDHMQRLHARCEEDEDRAITARESESLTAMHDLLASQASANLDCIARADWHSLAQPSAQSDLAIAQLGGPQRDLITASVANGGSRYRTPPNAGGHPLAGTGGTSYCADQPSPAQRDPGQRQISRRSLKAVFQIRQRLVRSCLLRGNDATRSRVSQQRFNGHGTTRKYTEKQ
jgi:hypothetical protein